MPIKSGWSRTNYFNAAWQKSVSAQARPYLVDATIEVYMPGLSDGEMNWETGEMEYTSTEEIVYRGPARVQPRRAAIDKSNNATDTTIQAVQFQIPLSETGPYDIRPVHRVRVTKCNTNPVLETYDYVINEVVDSSNPVEQTFWAKVDQEVNRG